MTKQQRPISYLELGQVITSRLAPNLSHLFLAGGLIFIVAGLTIIFMLTRLDTTSQDLRSQASQVEHQARLTMQIPASITAGDTLPITLFLQTTPNTQIDGTQLAISVPKQFFMTPTVELVEETNLNLAYSTITDNSDAYLVKVIIISQSANQPVMAPQSIPILKISAKTIKSGQTRLSIDNDLSMATLFHSQPVQNILMADLDTNIVIGDAVSPSPTPTADPQLPSLMISFKLQGASRADIATPAQITLTNQADSQQNHQVQTSFVSNSAGVFWPTKPIPVDQLNLDGQTQYQVAVKTNASLRKNLGSVKLTATPNQVPSGWQNQELIVGDFVQNGDNFNKIDISDIGLMFSRYNQLSVEALGELLLFDVNYDGYFDISDIAIVLSNYTQLEIDGD